jgi:hypothetical protein
MALPANVAVRDIDAKVATARMMVMLELTKHD